MSTIDLISWNVNGIRAAAKKGAVDWFNNTQPDILCVQELRATEQQVPPPLRDRDDYHCCFVSAERKGYSGVGVWSRPEPQRFIAGVGIDQFDKEGRTIRVVYDGFTLFNVYFPNGGQSHQRLEYKMAFYHAFLDHLKDMNPATTPIIVCGDVNTAHKEIDLARPKENEQNTGFLPQERAWIDRLIDAGFHDTFRLFNSEPGHYSWWDYKTKARDRNVGWRIDYFFVSDAMKHAVTAADILDEVEGSDHCPIRMTLEQNRL